MAIPDDSAQSPDSVVPSIDSNHPLYMHPSDNPSAISTVCRDWLSIMEEECSTITVSEEQIGFHQWRMSATQKH